MNRIATMIAFLGVQARLDCCLPVPSAGNLSPCRLSLPGLPLLSRFCGCQSRIGCVQPTLLPGHQPLRSRGLCPFCSPLPTGSPSLSRIVKRHPMLRSRRSRFWCGNLHRLTRPVPAHVAGSMAVRAAPLTRLSPKLLPALKHRMWPRR